MSSIHSVASSFISEGGKKVAPRLVTPAKRRLSPGSSCCSGPGLLFSVSGKLWQVEPLSAVILSRTVVVPVVYNERVGLFPPSLPGRV